MTSCHMRVPALTSSMAVFGQGFKSHPTERLDTRLLPRNILVGETMAATMSTALIRQRVVPRGAGPCRCSRVSQGLSDAVLASAGGGWGINVWLM